MKNLILAVSIFVSFFTSAQTITFESKVIDYGTIPHNSDGDREFKFTNTGTEPLIIKNAKGSCGCTVPSFKKEDGSSEWAPGESGAVSYTHLTLPTKA